jgi:hypothetical protein
MDLRWPQWLQHGYKQLTGKDIVDNIDTSEISNSIDETNITGNVDAESISDNDIPPGWPHDGDNCDEDMPTFTEHGAGGNDNEDMPHITTPLEDEFNDPEQPHIPTPEEVGDNVTGEPEDQIVKRDGMCITITSLVFSPLINL